MTLISSFGLPSTLAQGSTTPDTTTDTSESTSGQNFGQTASLDEGTSVEFPPALLDILEGLGSIGSATAATQPGREGRGGSSGGGTPYEPPCIERDPGSTGSSVGAMSYQEADQLAADQAAQEQAHLDAVIASGGGGPIDRHAREVKHTAYTPPSPPDKISTSSASNLHRFGEDFDQAETDSLWADIQAAEAAEAAAFAGALGAAPGGGGEPDCVEFFCYNERIEDVRFGNLSNQSGGGFAEYISLIGGFVDFANMLGVTGADATDLNELAGTISDAELGTRPSVTTMPVFYFCRRDAANGPIELAADPYWPSFDWGTSVEAEFDIPGTLADQRQQLRAQVFGRRPQIEAIPPVAGGFTFVKLPMWLWLVDPYPGGEVHTQSQAGTARIASRAVLINVTWTAGDETFDCTAEQMEEFVHGTSDLRTESSECSHTFLELSDYTLTAAANYKMQYQVTYRGHTGNAWPDAPWDDYQDPALQFVTISSTTPQMSVHPIVAVNVPFDYEND